MRLKAVDTLVWIPWMVEAAGGDVEGTGRIERMSLESH